MRINMKKHILALFLAAAAAAFASSFAHAQSGCPAIVNGAVLTAGQWNACFSAKNNTLGYIPLNTGGGTMTGPLKTAASITAGAGLNIVPGIAPTSPNNGDMWTTASGLYARVGGITIGPLSGGSSSSFSATSPILVTFPSGIVTYAFDFTVANAFLAQQTNQGATTTSPGWYARIAGDTVPRVRVGLNATDIASVSFGPGNAARDAFLERVGAGALRFGAPDAASAVAQTLSVQNVVAGTSNTAGAVTTFAASQGTGTGLGGPFLFKTAPAGSTGTTQNALVTAMEIYGSGGVTIGAPTGADQGAGFLNVAGGYKVNGASVGPITGGANGQTLQGVTSAAPLWTSALNLGVSGTAGSATFGNATSGTVTVQPVTGALGSVTASLPANTGTIAETNYAQSWTATQTLQTILAGTTNTYDVGTSATVAAFRTIYAGTSFVGPLGQFTTAAATPVLRPISDGTTALQVTKADGTTRIMDFDTTNARVGINKTPGAFDLDVNGAVNFGSTVNAVTGYQIGGAATAANVLRGNGTNFVSAILAAADLSNGVSGSGAVCLVTSCVMVTPTLGVAAGTSLAVGGGSIGSDALEVTGSTTHNGAVVVNAASFGLSGNQAVAAWTTSGVRYKNVAATLTDTTSTGTVATAYTDRWGGSTVAASNAGVTFTNYFGSYFNDAAAGTNVTLTNKWAVGADSIKVGTSNQFSVGNAGHVTAEGVTSTGATGTGKFVFDGSPSIGSLTVTTAFTATGLVTVGDLAPQAANTFLANVTGGSASPTAAAIPTCTGAASALQYSGGLSCGTITAAAASIAYGTTTAGTSVGIPYNATNGGVLSALTPVSGGVLYGSSATVPAFSTLLTQYGPIYGGGSGGAPVSMAAGTDGQIIVGQTGAAPLWKTSAGDVLSISTVGGFIFSSVNTHLTQLANLTNVGSLAVGNIVSGFGTILTTNTIGTAADTITSASANALAVGRQGATQPAFNVDASTASQTAGLNVKGAAFNGTVALAVIDTSGNTNLTINALGSGTIGIGTISTGLVTITPATTVTGTLTASNAFSAGSITGPLGTNSVKGVVEGDGTTISCVAGVCTALGASATSIDAGGATTTVSNGTTGYLLQITGTSPLYVNKVSASQLPGTTTNDNAGAGKIGEYVSASVTRASGVSLTSSTAANITSISLTAGDWDVWGTVGFAPGGSNTYTLRVGCVSLTSATTSDADSGACYEDSATGVIGDVSFFSTGTLRVSIASTTTVYLTADAVFAVSTLKGYGFIGARRVR